jgi:hypothetical protein
MVTNLPKRNKKKSIRGGPFCTTVIHSVTNMHFDFNFPTIYFQVTGIRLALRMEANLLVVLVALQIIMALRDWNQKLTASGSRERSINWNVQLDPLSERILLVLDFC